MPSDRGYIHEFSQYPVLGNSEGERAEKGQVREVVFSATAEQQIRYISPGHIVLVVVRKG